MSDKRFAIIVSVLGILCFSCGDLKKDEPSSLRRIIGNNDLQQVFKTSGMEEITGAVGLMALGCTANHIGNGFVISAGHCFTKQRMPGKLEDIPCSYSRHSITWDKTVDSNQNIKSECQEVIVLEHNSERDYALFTVSPIPEEYLSISEFAGDIGEQISIFSHPRKRPLEWSNWCEIESTLEKSNDFQFLYSCDTEGGSSGAAVLNENFEIIGIHNFYNSQSNRNGATFIHKTEIPQILASLTG